MASFARRITRKPLPLQEKTNLIEANSNGSTCRAPRAASTGSCGSGSLLTGKGEIASLIPSRGRMAPGRWPHYPGMTTVRASQGVAGRSPASASTPSPGYDVTAMQPEALAKLVDASRCRVFGHEDAGNGPQRAVLAALIRGFDHPDATVLCEPSLARKTTRPPDVVLVDPVAGVHVVEVKGVSLGQIEAIEPGGLFKIRYARGTSSKNPVSQARNAMFDVRDATARSFDGDLTLPFKYWVVLPSISRSEWTGRWGDGAYAPPELLFADDLPLARRQAPGGRPAATGEPGPRPLARRPVRLRLEGVRRLVGPVPPPRGAGGPACPGGHPGRDVRRGGGSPTRRSRTSSRSCPPRTGRAGRGWSVGSPAAARRSSWRTTWPAGWPGRWATARRSSR